MSTNKRPVSVTILACVYLAIGILGFGYHFRELIALEHDSALVELVELVAIVCGVFLLRGHDWARWLALAWIVFHVVLSIFHSAREAAIHGLFCVAIAWILLRSEAARYFHGPRVEST
jgi:hypothetical protein